MMKKIVLLEFTDEARSFITWCNDQNIPLDDFLIIALQSEVQIFLKNIKQFYENTEYYFSNQSQSRALLKSEEWYRLIERNLDIEDDNGINELYNSSFLFNMSFYMNHFLMYMEILNELSKKHQIDSIHACLYNNKIRINNPPLIQENERYFGQIAKKYSQANNITFIEIPAPSISVVRNNVNSANKTNKLNKKISDKLFRYLFTKQLNKKNLVLLTSAGYNMGKFASRIQKELPRTNWVVLRINKPSRCVFEMIALNLLHILYVLKIFKNEKGYFFNLKSISIDVFQSNSGSNTESAYQLNEKIEQIIELLKNELYGSFTYIQVNFLDIFIDKIQYDIKPYLISLYFDSGILGKILKENNIKLIISPFARETSLVMGEVCTNIGIPCLMISHGTVIKPKNKLEEIENYHMGKSLILCEYYNNTAIQTPSEKEHFEYFNCKTNPIITGPLIFSRSDPKRKEKLKKDILGEKNIHKKVFLYPENVRQRYNLRFHVFETFDEFLSSSIDLVNAINKIENVHFIIRLHPGREITTEEFRSLLPESDRLSVTSSNRPFSEMLSITDLLMNFSSTVIEDALQSHIPVLLFDKKNRYMHFESQKLGKNMDPVPNAVYYINNSSDLQEGLEWIIHNHLNDNAKINDSIFNKYAYQKDYFNNVVEFISETINY